MAVFIGLGRSSAPFPSEPPAKPIVVPKLTPEEPVLPAVPLSIAPPQSEMDIEQSTLDGQDVANVLNLWMWKFKFRIPQGRYTCNVWIERWTRGAKQPEVRLLFHQPLNLEGGEMVVKLPTAMYPQQLVRLGTAVIRSAKESPLEIGEPMRLATLEKRETFKIDEDIYLITLSQSNSIRSDSNAFGRKGIHGSNDVTIYVKARFSTGTPGPQILESGKTIDF